MTLKHIGTALKICVERVDKKGRKKVKIESYPSDIEAHSKILMYKLCGIKAWPYYRQLKKPKKLKIPEISEEAENEFAKDAKDI
jgi:hypothetical protein